MPWIDLKPESMLFSRIFCYVNVFFGEEQLAGFANENLVAVVGSEKTAILMSALMPDYTWLATGGLSNLNPAMFTSLKRCKIQLFPDLGGSPTWQKKADELKKAGFEVFISDLLERYARPEEVSAGFDLADNFIRRDLEFGWAMKEEGYPVFWDEGDRTNSIELHRIFKKNPV